MTKISVMGVPTGSFVSKWRIFSDDESISLPLVGNGNYDFIVNWGDGTKSHITSWDQVDSTHTYTKSGVKTVSITGTIEGWSFGYISASCGNIISIDQWGVLRLGDTNNQFVNCSNLTLRGVSDVLDLTGTTNLIYMFSNCTSLTTIRNISSWNVSNVTNMYGMFSGAISFNQDISNWDVSSVTDMSEFMTGKSTADYSYYDNLLGSWSLLTLQSSVTFGMGSIEYSSSASSARQSIIDNYSWTITDGGVLPVGIWYLDGVSKSANLINGAKYKTSTYTYTLDGVNDYAEIVNDGTITPTKITLEAWVNPIDLSNTSKEILRLESGLPTYFLTFQPPSVSSSNQDVIVFGVKTTAGFVAMEVIINPNDYLYKWTHLVATYESGTMSVYSNGTLIGVTTSQTGDILFNSSNNLLIGSYVGSQEFFNNKIGRPAIYTSVLDVTQVLTSYNTYKPLFDAEPLTLNLNAGSASSYPGSGTTWYDLSLYGNNGILTNGLTYNSSDGGVMIFDGIDDYVDFSVTDLSNTGNITIDTFLKLDGTQESYADIIDYSHATLGGFVVQQNSGGGAPEDFYFAWWNGSSFDFCNFQVPLTNTYFHLVITKNGGSIIVYINGVSSFTGSGSSYLDGTGRTMRVGNNVSGYSRHIKGTMGEFRIYNQALTPSEVLQNYNSHKSRYGL